ncbi:hypothetical protein SAMN02982917_1623 [Azospirillum oryzae]|uniref:Uncharacterized protein n=2 Tax=Azospirillum oryzae TaxID=286727 RepID=A0A1X7EGA7_9PROT|nr:hypothetical protein SAMN02982917_1623 [Azospirillum oryzae]
MVSRMARIVHMGKLGGYAALLDGTLLELDSRILWPSVPALTEALRQAGITPSDLILDTRSPAAVSAPAAASHRFGGLPLAA